MSPRTFDVRIWLADGVPFIAVREFVDAARQLAEQHEGIDVRWFTERVDRHGNPRIRIHPPPSDPGDTTKGGTR